MYNFNYKYMKKNREPNPLLRLGRKKIIVMMRLVISFCLLGLVHIPEIACAQVKRVSLEVKDMSINQALRALGKEFGKDFFYSNVQVDMNEKVSVNLKNVTIEDALKQIFNGKQVRYEEKENFVLILEVWEEKKGQLVKEVNGFVYDENAQPLPGVTVLIKGTSVGFSSDVNGKFKYALAMKLPVTLVFTSIGYEKQEVVVEDSTKVVNVRMKPDVTEVEEVVVTGYATIRKSSFTGAYTEVKREELLKVSQGNVIAALQVFDPSLRIMENNEMGSDPNTLPEFYVRGRSGISGVSELEVLQSETSEYALTANPNLPVFILDGYEVSAEKIYDMDPNLIENITILKDAAATAIYGSRAANGVIVIESVAPTVGKLNVTYNLTGSITQPDLTSYSLMDAREKLEAEVAAGLLDADDPLGLGTTYASRLADWRMKNNYVTRGVDTYWLSKPLRTGVNHNHSLNINGGMEAIRFALNLRYGMDNGVMKKSLRERFSVGLKLDYRMKSWQVTNDVSFARTVSENSPYGSFGDYVKMQPYFAPYDLETGELVNRLPKVYGQNSGSVNPLYEALMVNNESGSSYNQFTNNLGFNITFLENFLLKGTLSINYKDTKTRNFKDPASATFDGKDVLERGTLSESRSENFSWDMSLLLSYNRVFKDHNVNLSVGMNVQDSKSEYESTKYIGFPSSDLNKPQYANKLSSNIPTFSDNHTRLFGVFMMGNYSYKNIYLVDVSVRTDGSSEFGSDRRFATFYSAGLGVNMHNYRFLVDNRVFSQLRIRGTWGETGKVNYPPFAARHTYTVQAGAWHTTGMGATLTYMGNENLSWEKTSTLNLGLDLTLFKRYTLNLSWYDKVTNDLITDVAIVPSSGFTSYKDNMGKVRNRGVEVNLNVNAIQKQDWGLNVFFRASHNKNRIMEISDALKEYNQKVDDYYSKYPNYNKPLLKYTEGASLTSIYAVLSLGISPANGQEVFLDANGNVTYDWNTTNQVVVGNTEPKLQGSFGFNFRWKRWTLFTAALFETGGDLYNSTLVDNVECADIWGSNVDKRVYTQRWLEPGDVAPLKSIKDRYQVTRPTSRFVQRNRLVNCNSLSLGYEFDPHLVSRIGFSRMKLQLNMNEIAYTSSVKRERGLSYPFARTFNFTLNVTF